MAFTWKNYFGTMVFLVFSINFRRAVSSSVEQSGKEIYCYQCHSESDADCAYLTGTNTSSAYYKPCQGSLQYDSQEPFCRKIYQKIHARGGMEVVIRRCGWVLHPSKDCYRVKNIDHYEMVCQCFTAGCNSSPLLVQPISAYLYMFSLCAVVFSSSRKAL